MKLQAITIYLDGLSYRTKELFLIQASLRITFGKQGSRGATDFAFRGDLTVATQCQNGSLVVVFIFLHLRYSRIQVVEDAKICVLGSHISDPNRCSVMIMNSKHEEKVVADTDYRVFEAVACLNGEFAS